MKPVNRDVPDWTCKLCPSGQAQVVRWLDPNDPAQPPQEFRGFMRTSVLDEAQTKAIVDLGVQFGIQTGTIQTATIPFAALQSLLALDYVHGVEFPKKLNLM